MLENTVKVFCVEQRCRNISPSCRKWVSPPSPSPETSIPNWQSLFLYRMSLVTSCSLVPSSAIGTCICNPYGRLCSEQGILCKLWPHYQWGGWGGSFLPLLSFASSKGKLIISFTVPFLWPLALLQKQLQPLNSRRPTVVEKQSNLPITLFILSLFHTPSPPYYKNPFFIRFLRNLFK